MKRKRGRENSALPYTGTRYVIVFTHTCSNKVIAGVQNYLRHALRINSTFPWEERKGEHNLIQGRGGGGGRGGGRATLYFWDTLYWESGYSVG